MSNDNDRSWGDGWNQKQVQEKKAGADVRFLPGVRSFCFVVLETKTPKFCHAYGLMAFDGKSMTIFFFPFTLGNVHYSLNNALPFCLFDSYHITHHQSRWLSTGIATWADTTKLVK